MGNRIYRSALLVLLALSGAAWAQGDYPQRPIKLVVPFPPGGSVDPAARLIGQRLGEKLGKPIIVENRAGAGGAVGSDFVAQSPPDGYTLVWGTVSSHAINSSLYPKLPYDNLRDFAPVVRLLQQPLMVVVPPSSKLLTAADLLASLRSRDRPYNFGSAGAGTTGHMTGELLKRLTGGDLTHVAYKGSSPMLNDLVGGQIDLGIDNLPSALALVKAGRLRALAVTSGERSTLAPDIPALSELIPGMEVVAWQGLFAPAGTPPEILDRLAQETREVLGEPAIKARLIESGTFPAAGTRSEFAAFVRQETYRWREIVQAAGIKLSD